MFKQNCFSKLKCAGVILLSLFLKAEYSVAQLNVAAAGTTYTIDFGSTVAGVSNGAYTGAGFQATPTAGQLDADAWAVTGWSDGNLAFGGTRTTAATDYTRGSTAAAVGTGGFYSYTGAPGSAANPAFLIQPGGNDWALGTLTLKIQNNTGSTMTAVDLSYNLYIRNDQDRSSSFNFSYSTDDATYFPVAALNYTSPAPLDAAGYILAGNKSTTVSSLSIASGGFFYLRWSGDDVGGANSRDEFGLDDITVKGTDCSSVEPTTQSSALTFSSTSCNGTSLSWTAGNGSNHLVVAKSGSAVTGSPADLVSYAANPSFGSGSTIAAGEYVIYSGTGTSVNVSSLSAAGTYYFTIFEFNGSSPCQNYFLPASPVSANITTTTCNVCPHMTGALINSCNGTCSEGDNEILFMNSGSYSIPVTAANIVVKYENVSPATVNYTSSITSNTTFVNNLNTTAGCGTLFYDALTVGSIPPNTSFLIMRSTACFGFNFSTFCGSGPVYIVFSNSASWVTGGNFANTAAAGSLRYFRTDFSAVTSACITDYNYEPNRLSNNNGDEITFLNSGGAASSYVNTGGCNPSSVVLPIELLNFSAILQHNITQLKWETATELNNDYFTVQKSEDGISFADILKVDGAGNSSALLDYKAQDNAPLNGVSYYRLKQTDFNGSFSYSQIVSLNNSDGLLRSVFPNPVSDQLNIVFNDNSKTEISVEIVNMLGQLVYREIKFREDLSLDVTSLPKGIYMLKVRSGGRLSQQKFIKD